MKRLSTNEIRKMWLDFFNENDHYIEESKSLVPVNDKSLLFINSGVATLKKYFDGTEQPPSNRITNSQKSIRTNDIENVGLTSRHHTLFEMLGNFSIGDYFKDEAIEMAWDILTNEKWFAFDPEKLYVTVHPNDHQTHEKWLSLGVKESHIVALEENFWEIGEGPGGPNTEIFFDRGEKYDDRDVIGLLAEDLENDRIIEIWNIVFSQYNCNPAIPQTEYEELPQKNIDTGMGLERMACVMQEVETNFETDNFKIIIDELVSKTNIAYAERKMAYRVISDHVRALTFAIADGALPSNEGRGYVIRRILRRGVKYGYKDLNLASPFMYQLVDKVIEVMSEFYPYLEENKEFIKEVIEIEEEKFFQTISEGIVLLEKEFKSMDTKVLSGAVAFKLYDTFGFPIELTEELTVEAGYEIDKDGFKENLEEQRNRARNAIHGNDAMSKQNTFAKTIEVASKFIGYETTECITEIVYITDMNTEFTSSTQDQEVWVVLKEMPFYAESGGQVGDSGWINDIVVLDTKKLPNGQHAIKIIGEVTMGMQVVAKVDEIRRNTITKNHSATHMLHLSLQKFVGTHAKQAGSLQDDLKTRFDFTNLKRLDEDEIAAIEADVNTQINAANPVEINEMSIDAAKAMGANALFGEKYGDVVRVVKIGDAIELCGGTHVENSKEIGYFHILSESGIGSGVRRIEAITGDLVVNYANELAASANELILDAKQSIAAKNVISVNEIEQLINKISRLIPTYNAGLETLKQELEAILSANEELKKLLKSEAKDANKNLAEDLMSQVKQANGVNRLDVELEDVNMKEVRSLSDDLINRMQSGILVIQASEGNKVSVIVKVSNDVAKKNPANEILKAIIEPFNGRGGGKPTMAQGGYSK